MTSPTFRDPLLAVSRVKSLESEPASSSSQPMHDEAPRPQNTTQGFIGVQVAESNVQLESSRAHPRRSNSEDRTPTRLQNRIRSWAQAKGKSTLKEIGDRFQKPSPTTQLKHKVIKALGIEPSLRDRLFMASVTSHHPGCRRERFLPSKDLMGILVEEVVEKELAKLENRAKPALRLLTTSKNGTSPTADTRLDLQIEARRVCGTLVESNEAEEPTPKGKSYRKILAILILIRGQSKIRPFMEAGVSDADLPLRLVRADGDVPWKLWRKNEQVIPTHGFRDWEKSDFARFVEKQWVVLVPSFALWCGSKQEPQCFADEVILPFTAWGRTTKKGGFSQVFKVQIHSSHHTFNKSTAGHPFSRNTFDSLSDSHFDKIKTPETSPQLFAVKTISQDKTPGSPDPKYEVGILKRFNNDQHPHLISLLASYIQHRAYHLIFHWAEEDLFSYWQRFNPESKWGTISSRKEGPAGQIGNKPESDRNQTLFWLARQCEGLAEGLSRIHHYETASFMSLLHPSSSTLKSGGRTPTDCDKIWLFGRHGDIKPENILWFPGDDEWTKTQRGVLKITDFGIAEFSTKLEVVRSRRGFVANSPTYRAPENDIPKNDGLVSSSYDIWTLGCVYLEFLTWWLGGWDYVDDFRHRRLAPDPTLWKPVKKRPGGQFRSDVFFTLIEHEGTQEPEARVKKQVTDFMKELGRHPCSNQFVRKFLKMIRTEMIVVMSRSDEHGPHGRRSAANVAKDLIEMQEKYIPRKPDTTQDSRG